MEMKRSARRAGSRADVAGNERISEGAVQSDPELSEAIAFAESKARNDGEFVRLLNKRLEAPKPPAQGKRVITIQPLDLAGRSFKIFEDPRYQANLRALARRTRGGSRVIGGQPVHATEFLDCVAVGSDRQWGCTGTLLAPDVVLTAGHCANFATRIFIGSDVTKPGKIVAVKKRVPHPQYHKVKHHDLMVLLLKERVQNVAPRKIASKSLLDKAPDGRVVGFGATDPTGNFGYGRKLFVDVPIASNSCNGNVDGQDDNVTYGCDPALELVAGRPLLARDSCKGDSGGPFYVLDAGGNWLVGGATSRATDSAMHECGDGGVYVRLDRYRPWITSIPGVKLA